MLAARMPSYHGRLNLSQLIVSHSPHGYRGSHTWCHGRFSRIRRVVHASDSNGTATKPRNVGMTVAFLVSDDASNIRG